MSNECPDICPDKWPENDLMIGLTVSDDDEWPENILTNGLTNLTNGLTISYDDGWLDEYPGE